MGNQASLHHHHHQQQQATVQVPREPLESFSKEKQRDDHLKNLGFKRSKSIRKSIAKRLKRKKKQASSEDLRDGAGSTTRKASEASLETRVELVERPPPRVEVIERPATEKPDRPIVGLPQPLPSHVQVLFGEEKNPSGWSISLYHTSSIRYLDTFEFKKVQL